MHMILSQKKVESSHDSDEPIKEVASLCMSGLISGSYRSCKQCLEKERPGVSLQALKNLKRLG